MVFNDPDRVRALTPRNPFDRLPDGRPRVPDELLDRMKLVSPEEAWSILLRKHGYRFQFEEKGPVFVLWLDTADPGEKRTMDLRGYDMDGNLQLTPIVVEPNKREKPFTVPADAVPVSAIPVFVEELP